MKRRGSFGLWLIAALLLAGLVLLIAHRVRLSPRPAPAAPPPELVEREAGPEATNWMSVTGPAGQHATGSPLDDKLMDKTGGSVLIGLGGNDTYQAPDEKTRVVEQPGQGNDTIETWNNFKLPANVENLVLVGKNATGTAFPTGSRLTSKDLGNILESWTGSDTLVADPGARRTTFLFHPHSGFDAIENFKPRGEPHDFIRLTYPGLCDFSSIKAKLSASGPNDALLTLTSRDKILIRGVRPEALGPDDFLLCFSPRGMKLVFEDRFDSLSLYDRQQRTGRWKTSYTQGAADGPKSKNARRLARNLDEQIYVDPAYAGNPAVSRTPLGLNPFAIGGGILSIRAWRLPPEISARLWNIRFASGMLSSEPSFAQTYGYYEIRAELPQVRGMFPAFWLLPTARKWPPEIDIFENVGQDFVACGMAAPGLRRAFFTRFHGGVKGMHRYGVLWTPTRILWVFDGQAVGSAPTPPSLHQPMYMILNLAVGGRWSGSPRSDFRSAAMKIDYIRVYRWDPPR